MQHHSNSSGFTIAEMLVVIAILGVSSVALTSLIRSFYINNTYLLEQTTALDSARRGVGDAIDVLREASYGDDGSYPIATAGTSTVTVYSDLDGDASVERVRYFIRDNTLYRLVTNATGSPPQYLNSSVSTSTIATYTRNTKTIPLFTYYDDAGVQLSTTSPAVTDISSVRVTLMVDLNPVRAPNVFTLTQTATLRNLR